MIGEVSVLRQHQAAVEAELAEKQAELERAQRQARSRQDATWRWSGPGCSRALEVLRERLVAIYETGQPDVVNVVLESASWSEVNARADYLSQIQDYDDCGRRPGQGPARRGARPRSKRMAGVRRQIKEARDAIAVKEREVAAARAEARGALRRTEGGPGGTPRSARSARVARSRR